jgi:hypothetical protein
VKYPLTRQLLKDAGDWVDDLKAVGAGKEDMRIAELLHDALRSWLDGRTLHSFERGLEDEIEESE